MFERFTERARQVVVLAQDEAKNLGHTSIGTEHLLLGLIREDEGIAARVLARLNVQLPGVRDKVIAVVATAGSTPVGGQIPFTARAKKVLELALREALSLGHNYVGSEHLLLGLTREHEGLAARILNEYGATPDRIRDEIVTMLHGKIKTLTQPEAEMGGGKAAAHAISMFQAITSLNLLATLTSYRAAPAAAVYFRINVVEEKPFAHEAIEELAALAKECRCNMEFSMKHGLTFRPIVI